MKISTIEDLDKVVCEPYGIASFMLSLYFHNMETYIEVPLTKTELEDVELAINQALHPPTQAPP
jgi:hypothetical protein